MVMVVALLFVILILWLAVALYCQMQLGLSFHQALLYAPLKVLFRIQDRTIRKARNAEPPVIYAVWHQSRLEPALMLALLPSETLHILDGASSRSFWLDPWRALGRTVAFNAHHIFVNRRLVRRLKGNGRLAVYLPDNASPDTKTFRLFRAVARIAARAEARVVPVYVNGARHTPFSLAPQDVKRRLLPHLRVTALEPMTISELIAISGSDKPLAANAFFDRMLQARDLAEHMQGREAA